MPIFPGKFGNDMKYGVSSVYQLKFPLQGAMPFNPFGRNPNTNATQQAAPIVQVVADFPMTILMSLPSNLSFWGSLSTPIGFYFNNAKSVSPIQSILSEQQLLGNDIRFLRPKL